MSTPANQVDIDPAALASEADQVKVPDAAPAPGEAGAAAPGAEAAPPVDGAPGELSDEEAMRRAAELAPKLKLILRQLTSQFMPAWKVTDEECAQLAEAYALPCVFWWPDLSIPLKWNCLIMAALATWLFADSRRDTEGRLLPLRMKRAGASSAARQDANGGDAEQVPASSASAGRGFSTAA